MLVGNRMEHRRMKIRRRLDRMDVDNMYNIPSIGGFCDGGK